MFKPFGNWITKTITFSSNQNVINDKWLEDRSVQQ